ncbi:unnamed protein product [Penicillium egyptiacum]|uniref:Amino acid permease/ SLC12A domain-containing protein n=1 Tax=Penicillium egyptiacum TaxID=1303716 RepID=A0A9W4K984_9EURO|nr:unnamed protein product [Penicillium egyptiacum]
MTTFNNLISRQGLKQRHIQMIALAGTIGTVIRKNPSQFLSIMLTPKIGTVSKFWSSYSKFRASRSNPGVLDSIIRHAEYSVDPALSFAQGWNIAYAYFISIAGEIVAAAVLVEFWISLNSAIWVTVFGVLVCGGGPAGEVHGAQYWHNPGPFVQYLNIPGKLGQFLGVWSSFTPAVYSFASVENVALLAGETQNPRQNIPKAAKRILARVVIFYIITIMMITFLVPSNDPDLLKSTGTAAQSPFVLSAQRAGIKVLPSIINAIVLTSAWSSGNSILMGGSRVLFGLSQEKHAPSVLKRVSRWGVPYVAVSIMSLSICLGYLTSSSGATIVFTWLQNMIAAYNFVAWMVICVVYLRFYYAMQKQGITLDELPWKAPFQPYAAWASLICFFILLLTSGFRTFIHKRWSTQTFISSYLDIAILAALYFGYKFWQRTQIISLDEVPLRYYIDQAHQNQEPSLSRNRGWSRLNILWG